MLAKTQHNVPLPVSLPRLRNVSALTTQQISRALHILRDAICPLRPLDFGTGGSRDVEALDSGYVSTDQDDNSAGDAPQELDAFERAFAEKWLTGLIGRADELAIAEAESFTEVACSILAHLTGSEEDDDDADKGDEEDMGMMRRFEFEIGPEGSGGGGLGVDLHDKPMQTGRDHTDVGLQTWGASIVMSRLLARQPGAFGFSGDLQPDARIVELGAGTGLVSLVLSSLLGDQQPLIVATDFHPTVLANLEKNAAAHVASHPSAARVKVCHLDWSTPRRDAPLDVPAKIIVAADVAYAPEHAAWLRDCAAELLADDGVFWLMVSIRPNGKFEGISDVVEAAFEAGTPRVREAHDDSRVLKIVSTERLHKLDGVGRADEVAYKLYKVIWQVCGSGSASTAGRA